MRKLLLANCLLLGLAGTGPRLAQAQATTPPGRYYLGLGGAVGAYSQGRYGTSVLAPTLTGGWRLSPRLALEASLLVHHDRNDWTGYGVQTDDVTGAPRPVVFRGVYLNRTQALSLAARYTLWQPRAGRFSLDALGGLALVHSDAYGYNATLDQATGQPVLGGGVYVRSDQANGCLLLGPSLRYQAGRHLALAAEFVANFAPGERVARFGRVLGTLGLSARYCFGPAPAARP